MPRVPTEQLMPNSGLKELFLIMIAVLIALQHEATLIVVKYGISYVR
jgi:hypothetical protein